MRLDITPEEHLEEAKKAILEVRKVSSSMPTIRHYLGQNKDGGDLELLLLEEFKPIGGHSFSILDVPCHQVEIDYEENILVQLHSSYFTTTEYQAHVAKLEQDKNLFELQAAASLSKLRYFMRSIIKVNGKPMYQHDHDGEEDRTATREDIFAIQRYAAEFRNYRLQIEGSGEANELLAWMHWFRYNDAMQASNQFYTFSLDDTLFPLVEKILMSEKFVEETKQSNRKYKI